MVRDGDATPCNVSSGAEVPTHNSVERRSVFLGGGHDHLPFCDKGCVG